jgi:Protein of unknown function (DUF2505)
MKIEATLRYPADCARVAALTADPAFQDAKCVATGALSHSVDVTATGDRFVIKTVRRMPTDTLPDFVRSLVRNGITVNEVDDWGPAGADGSRDAAVAVSFAGAPIQMNGTLALRPVGTGSVGTLRADLSAGIPFIGGRIEQACAHAVLAAVKVEERTAASWLAR